MSKEKICKEREFNNNGWCNKRKTNKGLKDLTECEYRKDSKIATLERYLEQKKFELQIENTHYNRGIIKGIEIALMVIKNK